MLEIIKQDKTIFPFGNLTPKQLFLRQGRSGSVYYSFINQNGELTVIDLANGEEDDCIPVTENIEVINGKLIIK